jgi:hypothetical protein
MAAHHDAQFKALLKLKAVLRDFFVLFLPDIACYIDSSQIEFVDKERFTIEGSPRTGDLLIKTRFRNDSAAFLIHLEHQAQNKPCLEQRVLEYFVLDWRDFKMPVYPVLILSHGAGTLDIPMPVTMDFPGRRILEFNFPIINLTHLDAKRYAVLRNTAALALSAVMKVAPADRIRLGIDMVGSLDKMAVEDPVRETVAGFFFSNHRFSRAETLKFHEELAMIRPRSRRERIMQWTNPWIELGVERGLERGIKSGLERGMVRGLREGRQREAAVLVSRLLRRGFGSLSADVEPAIHSLSLRKLESLGEALLDFKRLEDLATWLHMSLAGESGTIGHKRQKQPRKSLNFFVPCFVLYVAAFKVLHFFDPRTGQCGGLNLMIAVPIAARRRRHPYRKDPRAAGR